MSPLQSGRIAHSEGCLHYRGCTLYVYKCGKSPTAACVRSTYILNEVKFLSIARSKWIGNRTFRPHRPSSAVTYIRTYVVRTSCYLFACYILCSEVSFHSLTLHSNEPLQYHYIYPVTTVTVRYCCGVMLYHTVPDQKWNTLGLITYRHWSKL